VATESYSPNILVARSRLEPLGVKVVGFTDDNEIPLEDQQFELIINRHESYSISELDRLLKPGGRFITQQVGSRDCFELNQFLDAPFDSNAGTWSLEQEVAQFEEAGFHIERAEEALLASHFYDIGAVVFFLKIIEWQIPDFTPQKYHDRLLAMHHLKEDAGAFRARGHRFLIQASR
jgi:SAM-dependent methyltransferase